MKKIIVTGHAGRDPELRYSQAGDAFATFSIAIKVGKDKTDWAEVTCNGKTSENVMQYVKKGSKLLIEGTPSADAYVNKEGKPVATLKIFANNVEFLSSKEDQQEQQEPDNTQDGFNAQAPDLKPDDIPFN